MRGDGSGGGGGGAVVAEAAVMAGMTVISHI